MTKRSIRLITMFLAATLLKVGGCGNKADQGYQMSRDDEMRQQAARSPFETAGDPPITVETRFAAGQLCESQNSPFNAIEQYKKAMEIDPKHQPSLYRLGLLYTQGEKYPDAIATWKRYIEATNEAATGYSNLGFCQELAGAPDQAEVAYLKGIEKDPANQPCRVNYGLMLARHGRTNEAMIQLQAVLSPAQVHYNLASVYELQGHKSQAKAEYLEALKLDPTMTDAQTRVASLSDVE